MPGERLACTAMAPEIKNVGKSKTAKSGWAAIFVLIFATFGQCWRFACIAACSFSGVVRNRSRKLAENVPGSAVEISGIPRIAHDCKHEPIRSVEDRIHGPRSFGRRSFGRIGSPPAMGAWTPARDHPMSPRGITP
jgi:hypothetical protein